MKKVVVTGYGIISCIGNSKKEVIESLKDGKSGISLNQSYVDMGFRSHVSGSINLKLEDLIDRKLLRFMSHASAYAYLAALEAIAMANITEENLNSVKTGIYYFQKIWTCQLYIIKLRSTYGKFKTNN